MGQVRLYAGTHKPLGSPTLRRDPTAHEKLKVIREWHDACTEHMVLDISSLSSTVRKSLEKAGAWPCEKIKACPRKENALRDVAKRRLGLRGLRVFGSTAPTSYKRVGQGCRTRVTVPGVATKLKPLERVYQRLQ